MPDENSADNHSDNPVKNVTAGSQHHRNDAKLNSYRREAQLNKSGLWQKWTELALDRKIELFFTGLVAFTTGVYAYYSAGLWQQTADLATQAKNQTALQATGQRPWLLIENVRLKSDPLLCRPASAVPFGIQNVTLLPGVQMWPQWDVRNVGATTATNIRNAFKFYIGAHPADLSRVDEFGGMRLALGPTECDSSPSAGWVWLDARDQRTWNTTDAERLTAGEKLWLVVSVEYDTPQGIHGFSSFCGYYDNSLFTNACSVVK